MSLFDDAKLIITPNGYKAGKLYSLKPFDGSGDCTVVRNTTATRVKSGGLIESSAVNVPRLDYSGGVTCPAVLVEPQRTNLLLRSEEFDLAPWSGPEVVVTPNFGTSPKGTLTADKILMNSSLTRRSQSLTLAPSTTYTISFYVKNISLTSISSTLLGSIDLFATISYASQLVIGQWVRIVRVFTTDSVGSVTFQITRAGNLGGEAEYWGAQVEEGSTATSYIPSVAATVTRNADVITATVPAGVTEITEYFEDGTTNVITTIPVTYTMSVGRISKVVMI